MARGTARPNLFDLAGGHTTVTYTTTGIAGKPTFSYDDGVRQVAATGTDIRTKATEIGTLVTVDLDVVADGPTTTVSLLLPTVNLAGATERPLRTIAVVTVSKSTIGGPGLVVGQVQSCTTTRLRGTARLVIF